MWINFIAKDQQTLMTLSPTLFEQSRQMTYLEMLMININRILVVNSNGNSKLDGNNAMKIL